MTVTVATVPRRIADEETRLRRLTGRAERVFDALGRLVALDGGSVVYDVASGRTMRCAIGEWRSRWGAGYRMEEGK